nr:FAD binding domain-containing protein [Candidatus Bipolaricaulota bacterium]
MTLKFVKAATLESAFHALSDPGAAVLCGGTDLMVKLRSGAASCATLVDVSDLAELRELGVAPDRVVIGAGVPESEILDSEAVCARLPLLERALRSLGSSQIRNRGTLGGNLVNASP